MEESLILISQSHTTSSLAHIMTYPVVAEANVTKYLASEAV
jgi:hypothetical protein